MTVPPVVVEDLKKRYGSFEALRGVSIALERGEIFGLLGPNGAGKTTLVEILEGFRSPTSGSVRVLGADPLHAGGAWRARIGLVLQDTTVFEWLSVEEVVTHFAGFYPAPRPVGDVLETVGLAAQRRQRCASLSGGQKRRVDLALGLVGDPELIFLDEPTTGLDPEARRQLWGVIRSLSESGKTLLLTTHYLDEAETLSDRVGIIIDGQLAAIGPADSVGRDGRPVAKVTFRNPLELPLPDLPGVVSQPGSVVSVQTDAPTQVVRILAEWAGAHGVAELPGLAVSRASLEDIYLSMVERQRDAS